MIEIKKNHFIEKSKAKTIRRKRFEKAARDQ